MKPSHLREAPDWGSGQL